MTIAADMELVMKHLVSVENCGESPTSYSCQINPKGDRNERDRVHELVREYKHLLPVGKACKPTVFASVATVSIVMETITPWLKADQASKAIAYLQNEVDGISCVIGDTICLAVNELKAEVNLAYHPEKGGWFYSIAN
ncbi:hypothetical protein [Neptuniibacter sp. QD37_11]|uniref:hypothetical protein n=1 Tax=Neptuniibacter sp. QD37_11 TaxID=3398209 RepID=UPI0039F44B13